MPPVQPVQAAASPPRSPATWVLLIYTVPAEPTRLRASIWRELKKVGAEYLRDGVSVLPEREETVGVFTRLAAKVHEFGGHATIIRRAQLDDGWAAEVIAQMRADRESEYDQVAREARRFLEHVERERGHRELSYLEVDQLAADLVKLRRWAGQARARDHLGVADAAAVERLLARCDDALRAFLAEANDASREQDEAPM
jgi:hypothetical protein